MHLHSKGILRSYVIQSFHRGYHLIGWVCHIKVDIWLPVKWQEKYLTYFTMLFFNFILLINWEKKKYRLTWTTQLLCQIAQEWIFAQYCRQDFPLFHHCKSYDNNHTSHYYHLMNVHLKKVKVELKGFPRLCTFWPQISQRLGFPETQNCNQRWSQS